MKHINSKDGTSISYKVIGNGPGLLIVHGSGRASQHYKRLSEYLADSFTVYIIDRRGRNESGPRGTGYCLETECKDVVELMKKHDISYLFGHSYGGLISLNAAIEHPVAKLAVYEPPISIDGSFPASWLPRFERELLKEDYISAFVTEIKGLGMGGIISKLPRLFLIAIFKLLSRKPEWEATSKLLLTLPDELREVIKLDSEIKRYKNINVPTLLITGSESPDYFSFAAQRLVELMPDARFVKLDGLDHNAPDETAPEKVAQYLKDFFV